MISRRDFLKLVGIVAVAPVMPKSRAKTTAIWGFPLRFVSHDLGSPPSTKMTMIPIDVSTLHDTRFRYVGEDHVSVSWWEHDRKMFIESLDFDS